jgi:microcin C transport system permease protein
VAASRGHALRNYIIRRTLLMVPTFIGITLVTFVLCQFVPGGPIQQAKMRLAGAGGGGEAGGGGGGGGGKVQNNLTPEQEEQLNKYYGFDKPIHQRYFSWLYKVVFQFDLGFSFRYTDPVTDVIFNRIHISLFFGLVTTILTYVVCIPLGIVKAIKHRTGIDNATSFIIFIGYAIPGYALGAVLLVAFAVQRDWFPIGGFTGAGFDQLSTAGKAWDIAHHAALPVICYMVGSFAVMTMLMKNSLMENMSADYVKTALAKGLSWPSAIFGHAVRNSLIPLATSFGSNVTLIITGSVLIERMFNINGIGLLAFTSIQARDYPVVMGMVVVSSVLMLIGNLLSDICVAMVDPRVRFE